MRAKKLFVTILLVTILLIFWCIQMHKNRDVDGLKIQSVDFFEEVVHLEAVMMKNELRETQEEIDAYLVKHPILFLTNSALLQGGFENNRTLEYIVSLFECTEGEFAITIVAHSDTDGSSSHNRKLSQKRADALHQYIASRYQAQFINAIGYGEEFPLSTEENQTSNRRIEIKLRRVYNGL
jgi:outer membrane protein OmpA-like peptidoglycan-associated protein